MTRGRKGNTTYTGYHGVNETTLRAIDKLAKTPAGEFGRVTNPNSVDAIRRSVEAFMCPWCGAGPYKILAIHTHRAHGVDRNELRELCGLFKNASITPDDVRDRNRRRGKEVGIPAAALSAPRKPRRYSTAGLALQREKLDKGRSPEQCRAAALASAARTLAKTEEQHAEAAKLWQAGKGMREIARTVGLSEQAVRRGLRRAGLYEDGRARPAARPSAEVRRAMIEAQRSAVAQQTEKRCKEFLAHFADLGGDWSAVAKLGLELGITKKSVVQRLRDAGVDLPDGRVANPRRGPRPELRKAAVPCTEVGCGARATRRGLCGKHYQRAKSHGAFARTQ